MHKLFCATKTLISGISIGTASKWVGDNRIVYEFLWQDFEHPGAWSSRLSPQHQLPRASTNTSSGGMICEHHRSNPVSSEHSTNIDSVASHLRTCERSWVQFPQRPFFLSFLFSATDTFFLRNSFLFWWTTKLSWPLPPLYGGQVGESSQSLHWWLHMYELEPLQVRTPTFFKSASRLYR